MRLNQGSSPEISGGCFRFSRHPTNSCWQVLQCKPAPMATARSASKLPSVGTSGNVYPIPIAKMQISPLQRGHRHRVQPSGPFAGGAPMYTGSTLPLQPQQALKQDREEEKLRVQESTSPQLWQFNRPATLLVASRVCRVSPSRLSRLGERK
jgi:hypothetical protein